MKTLSLRKIVAWEIGIWAIILLIALALHACGALQGGVIGGATGAALTKTPEGAGVGFAAGLLVGAWNDITHAVSSWWHNLWGKPEVPPPSTSTRIWSWLLLLALFGFVVKFAYHFVWDRDFRSHVFTLLSHRLKRKK